MTHCTEDMFELPLLPDMVVVFSELHIAVKNVMSKKTRHFFVFQRVKKGVTDTTGLKWDLTLQSFTENHRTQPHYTSVYLALLLS